MLNLHINTPMRPSASPVRAMVVASPATRASRQAVRPVFYDETQHRRIAVEIASALMTVTLMILLTFFAISISVDPHLPASPLPKAAITRTADTAAPADLLPARRTTAGHTTARAQSQPAVAPQAQVSQPELVTGYITTIP